MSATLYVYQAHFSADKQLVSCTQIDIFYLELQNVHANF